MNIRTLSFACFILLAGLVFVLSNRAVAGTVMRCADGTYSDVCVAKMQSAQSARPKKKAIKRPLPRGAQRVDKTAETRRIRARVR